MLFFEWSRDMRSDVVKIWLRPRKNMCRFSFRFLGYCPSSWITIGKPENVLKVCVYVLFDVHCCTYAGTFCVCNGSLSVFHCQREGTVTQDEKNVEGFLLILLSFLRLSAWLCTIGWKLFRRVDFGQYLSAGLYGCCAGHAWCRCCTSCTCSQY